MHDMRKRSWLLATLGIALAGCPQKDDTSNDTQASGNPDCLVGCPCEKDLDCAFGFYCLEGQCRDLANGGAPSSSSAASGGSGGMSGSGGTGGVLDAGSTLDAGTSGEGGVVEPDPMTYCMETPFEYGADSGCAMCGAMYCCDSYLACRGDTDCWCFRDCINHMPLGMHDEAMCNSACGLSMVPEGVQTLGQCISNFCSARCP